MNASTLTRHVFKTSRLAEFASKKELVNQTGHAVEDWPLVVLKELVDNASKPRGGRHCAGHPNFSLARIASPSPTTDPASPRRRSRTSSITRPARRSREAYVSPTRGAQGNALKTILAMPFALDGERGETMIESHGVSHRIAFAIDRSGKSRGSAMFAKRLL